MKQELTIEQIYEAYKVLSSVVHKTPLEKSRTFSELGGTDVYLKMENLQKTGSFKLRGAYYKMATLNKSERERGVIAASAGNHAQGVALAAALAQIRATVVMPEYAPLAKIMATQGYGAEVVLSGTVYDEAYAKAKEIEAKTAQTFIHAFDDYEVMAGQGTIGLEILESLPAVQNVIIPIGGGGLAAGVATAIKSLKPSVRMIGVQAEGASAMCQSLQKGQKITTHEAVTMADGIAVKVPGDKTYKVVQQYMDEIVLMDDEAIASAILMLLERAKVMVEGAGAISLAAALSGKLKLSGPTVCLLSGGNIDVNFISRIIERGLVKAGRRIRLRTLISDRPGELQRFLGLIAQEGANVIQVAHDRTAREAALSQAVIELQLETRDVIHTEQLMKSLKAASFVVQCDF